MKKIFAFIAVSVMTLSCSTGKTVLTEQSVREYRTVLDSIRLSGTEVGPIRTWSFITDDNRRDEVFIGTLYKKEKATGSIQIRKRDSVYDIKIIDVIKRK